MAKFDPPFFMVSYSAFNSSLVYGIAIDPYTTFPAACLLCPLVILPSVPCDLQTSFLLIQICDAQILPPLESGYYPLCAFDPHTPPVFFFWLLPGVGSTRPLFSRGSDQAARPSPTAS